MPPAVGIFMKNAVANRNLADDPVPDLTTALDSGWTLTAGFLVLFMHAGFTLVETGYSRAKNSQSIIMKNLVNCACAAIAWFLLGYGFAFGEDNKDANDKGGFIGTDMFAPDNAELEKRGEYVNFFFQWTFCATAATIVSGAVAERCTIEGFGLMAFFLTAFLYPVQVHWVWGGGWLYEKEYSDFAGSGVVHMFGGVCALLGAEIVGPRKGRFLKEGSATDEEVILNQEIGPSSLLNVTLGTFILWFGWYGFNAGSSLALSGDSYVTAARCCVTTTMSAAGGGLSAFCIAKFRHKKYCVASFANGILGGLVGITAGCGGIEPGYAFIIGIIAAFWLEGAVVLLEKIQIDDVVGAFPVHGACGCWGVLAVGLFDINKGWFYGTGFSDSLGPQIIGILAIAGWACLSAPVWMALKAVGMLRVPEHAEHIGIDQYEFRNSQPVAPLKGGDPEKGEAEA